MLYSAKNNFFRESGQKLAQKFCCKLTPFFMSQLLQIKKRSGEIVSFDPVKIHVAITKAFLEVTGKNDDSVVRPIADHVISHIEEKFKGRVPGVEDVQNTVEQVLMEQGLFPVAKSYIIYRYEHTKVREEKKQEMQKRIEEEGLYIVKRSGKREAFSPEKLRRTIAIAARGLEKDINIEAVLQQCRVELYEEITTGEITKALTMVLRSFIEQDPAYSKVAARILLQENYKNTIGYDVIDYDNLDNQYRVAFIRNMKRGVEIERLDPKMLAFDLEKLAKALIIENDDMFNFLGIQTLYDRYFLTDHDTKQVLETPQMFWMRIAMGLALNEKENRYEHTINFYRIMSEMLYTPSTPTLFHAGTHKPQLSSCYLNTVTDSLDNIFKTYADNAQLSKWSGGIGTDWTNIRGTGAYIQGTGVESQGVIPFLKIANDVTVAINRSGRRRGAACVYLEVWHYDIESFIELRKNTGDERRRTHDMDIASWIPDLFMKRVKENGDWTLFSSEEVPDLHHIYGKRFEARYAIYEKMADEGKIKMFKRMKAQDLWKKMITMLFETGHPWITWKDPSNVRSPQDHVGVIHNSNLCTEITLNTSENETAVCNLGSLNFAKFIVNGKYDVKLVEDTVRVAMRMLDNTIDINYYPTEDSRRSNFRHRPVGMGVRGFQDALYMLGIRFDSKECIEFADYSMEVVSYYSILASSELAKERGAYETYRGSKWDRNILPQDTLDLLEEERGVKINVPRGGKMDWTPVRAHIAEFGMRNSNCLAIAPTASTANIVGCVPTIEPIYKNIYVQSNQAGDFIVINPYLVDELKSLHLWDFEMLGKIKYHDGSIADITEIPESTRAKYKEVFEIDPRWLIESAAYRGKWIDQSQSLNIYFRGASGRELSEIYMYAWELGLKTTYYLRTLAVSQVEKSTVNTNEFGSTHHRKEFASMKTEETAAPVVEAPVAVVVPMPEPVRVAFPTPAEVAGMTVAQKAAAAEAAGVKVCRLDDPSCESCQS
jgi:ribonucleoside-diphosphate reductase alpha chain